MNDWAADVIDNKPSDDFEEQLSTFVLGAVGDDATRIHEPADGYPVVRFKVGGAAATQGSKTTGTTKSGIRFTRESNKRLPQWRTDIAAGATAMMEGHELLAGSLILEAIFVFPRPASHYTSRMALTKSARLMAGPTSHQIGDTSKLIRAIEDAMTKIVYLDDSQITTINARKRWGIAAATYITVRPDPLEG